MSAAKILHVGDDICHRIPVMQRSGLVVLRSESSVHDVRSSFARGDHFSAVTFHNDLLPPDVNVVVTVRELCRAPLILFDSETVECDHRVFDLVIPLQTPPEIWSKTLRIAIDESRRLRELSQQLRQDCSAVRDRFRSLEASIRDGFTPVDYDALFRGNTADGPAAERSDDESAEND